MTFFQYPQDNLRWCQQQLARYQYKPGWSMEITGGNLSTLGTGALLHVRFNALDSRRRHEIVSSSGTVGRDSYAYHGWQEMDWYQQERASLPQGPVIPIQGKFEIPWPVWETMDEELFMAWLRDTLLSVERHEMDEWFARDGQLVDDPHEVKVKGITPK